MLIDNYFHQLYQNLERVAAQKDEIATRLRCARMPCKMEV